MSKSAWSLVALLLFTPPATAAVVHKASGTRGGKPYMEATDLRTTTATVIAIDKATRVVKMRTEEGDTIAVVAGPEVKNLSQIKVSDVVKASVVEQLRVEVTAAPEMKDTSEVSATSAGSGETPHGTITKRSRSTATITAIDVAAGTVTLKGQDGNTFAVKPKQKENLGKVKVGDLVVFTVTKSVAASVVKAGD